jgi:hypothetical protein
MADVDKMLTISGVSTDSLTFDCYQTVFGPQLVPKRYPSSSMRHRPEIASCFSCIAKTDMSYTLARNSDVARRPDVYTFVIHLTPDLVCRESLAQRPFR